MRFFGCFAEIFVILTVYGYIYVTRNRFDFYGPLSQFLGLQVGDTAAVQQIGAGYVAEGFLQGWADGEMVWLVRDWLMFIHLFP